MWKTLICKVFKNFIKNWLNINSKFSTFRDKNCFKLYIKNFNIKYIVIFVKKMLFPSFVVFLKSQINHLNLPTS